MMEKKPIWVVWTNTDLNEGRGRQYPKAYCELEATANRIARGSYVQGTNCPVKLSELFKHEGVWYGEIVVTKPTVGDKSEQEKINDRKNRVRRKIDAIQKAAELGLSDDDIEALSFKT